MGMHVPLFSALICRLKPLLQPQAPVSTSSAGVAVLRPDPGS